MITLLSNDEYVYISGTAMKTGQYKAVTKPTETIVETLPQDVIDSNETSKGLKSKKIV